MKYRGKKTGNIYKVIFSDEYGLLTESVSGRRIWWTNKEVEEVLEEYREPRTAKGYANIWGGPDGSVYIGSVYPTRGRAVQERSLRAAEAARREGGAPASEYDSLDIIEISWTEKV